MSSTPAKSTSEEANNKLSFGVQLELQADFRTEIIIFHFSFLTFHFLL